MGIKSRLRRYLQYIIMLAVAAGVIIAMYYGSIPEKYTLNVGDASPFDINATRRVVDEQATEQRAAKAASDVPDVYMLDGSAKKESLTDLEDFFAYVISLRNDYFTALEEKPVTPEPDPEETTGETDGPEQEQIVDIKTYSDELKKVLSDEMGIELADEISLSLITMDHGVFDSLVRHTNDIAELIMSYSVSAESLNARIITSIDEIQEDLDNFDIQRQIPEKLLAYTLRSNLRYDPEATNEARDLAYNTVMNNPVLIEKGTRIVSFGEIITAEKYELLMQMDMIDTGEFDFVYLGGVILLIILIIGIVFLYVQKDQSDGISGPKDKIAIGTAVLIPFFISLFTINISTLSPPVYFSAVLITAYYGFKTGIFMSIFLSFAIFPLTSFDPKFLFVAITGSIVASLFTLGMSRRNNYALIIISTTLSCFLSAAAIDIMMKQSFRDIFIDTTHAVVSSSLSIILALGIMPLFEMIFNSVSPLRLIELAQPGNPVLSRLFTEAPGTSQHCVMVANLSEGAAEAVGANPLLARVGAYYHDIGKLEDPGMFTENQLGENPHDRLGPYESAKIILSHPEAGVRLAKKYRLPPIIIKMIYEHHGTTMQKYFYNRACEETKNVSDQIVDPEDFRYSTGRPSFKESAILMLADTVEAAMKSTGITDIEKAEELIRKLVKQKIAEDQLIDSDLSFKDVENIIRSFLNVYSGHFRIRIKYPDENTTDK